MYFLHRIIELKKLERIGELTKQRWVIKLVDETSDRKFYRKRGSLEGGGGLISNPAGDEIGRHSLLLRIGPPLLHLWVEQTSGCQLDFSRQGPLT